MFLLVAVLLEWYRSCTAERSKQPAHVDAADHRMEADCGGFQAMLAVQVPFWDVVPFAAPPPNIG